LVAASAVLTLAAATASCGPKITRPPHLGQPRPGPAVAVGVNTDITWGIPWTDVTREVALMRRAHVMWVRASVDLSGVEPSRPGQFNPAYMGPLDRVIRAARAAGLQILMEPDRTPYWASADPGRHTNRSGLHWNPYWTYNNPQDYARVVADLVRHFKRMGVHTYELWNEPNYPRFWPSGVNAWAYTKLLATAYPAVKTADPKATVVMGGLSNLGAYNYLHDMYRAGAARFYDVANFHLYPAGNPASCTVRANGRATAVSFCLLDELRSEMLAHGDHKPVVITEIGWSTCTSSHCVSQQAQATYLTTTFRLLNDRAYAWVDAVFVYAMRDLASASSNATWGTGLGLVTKDLIAKPAYAAVSDASQRARRNVADCYGSWPRLEGAGSADRLGRCLRYGRAAAPRARHAASCLARPSSECRAPIS
jgi:polysaccharide biosynthesis protein PslG